MSRPFPDSRWTAVSLCIFWSISVFQQRCIKMTCDRWIHVCDTPRHPRTLVILRLDLHTADQSKASAKQSTGNGDLTEIFRRRYGVENANTLLKDQSCMSFSQGIFFSAIASGSSSSVQTSPDGHSSRSVNVSYNVGS